MHRLDKETSGVLVVAKNDFAHEHLTQQFKDRTTHRIYYAVVFGKPKTPLGRITSHLARHPTHRKKYASIPNATEDQGKWAATNYEVLKSSRGLSLVRLKLETGRTHQIRVHLSEQGCPIVGDELYGADRKIKSLESKSVQSQVKDLRRFLLHAAELGFTHPRRHEWMEFSTDWPLEDKMLLNDWGLV